MGVHPPGGVPINNTAIRGQNSNVPSQMPTGAAMHPGAMNQQRIGAQMGGMQMRGVTQGGPRMAPPNMRNT